MYKYIIHQKEIKKRLEICGLKRHIFNHTVKLMCSFIKNLAVLKLRFNIQIPLLSLHSMVRTNPVFLDIQLNLVEVNNQG